MLAARDQENLVHGHQAAAAIKPLNQGNRQLQPKTPGNKLLKTPFKVPLNDDINAGVVGIGKLPLRTGGKGNENLLVGGEKGQKTNKNAFITPMRPRSRAPLGLKTTNAKAKAFQTPAPAPVDNDLNKPGSTSATARKPKPKAQHAEIIKLEVFGDKDDLEYPEIESMPTKVNNLPDLPDDMPHDLDFSMFQNGGLTRDAMLYYVNKPDEDGFSFAQRQQQADKEMEERRDKKLEALMIRDLECARVPCFHEPECSGGECKVMVEVRQVAEEKCNNVLASLDPRSEKALTEPTASKGPSLATSKRAAAALSHPKPASAAPKPRSNPPALKAKIPSSLLSSRKKPPPPTNPSPMRHAAATAASMTTMGYSKGRATSASLRKTILPKKDIKPTSVTEQPDTSLPPDVYIKRYGAPPVGSDMYWFCKNVGCFDQVEGMEDLWGGKRAEEMWREEAEEDFALTW